MEKEEASPFAILFESKLNGNQSLDAWVRKVMAVPGNSNKMLLVGIKKALDYLRTIRLPRFKRTWSF